MQQTDLSEKHLVHKFNLETLQTQYMKWRK